MAETTNIAQLVMDNQAESRLSPQKNVRLCDDCQYWDNPRDAFDFMEQLGVNRGSSSLENMLQRHTCMICRVITSAVQAKIERFGWRVTDPRSVQIHVGTAFEVLRQEMPTETLTTTTTTTGEERTSTHDRLKVPPKFIKCVLYLDLHDQKDPPETGLRKQLSWHWWPAPTLGLQLLLEYDRDPIRLANVTVWEEKYLDVKLMKRWTSNCESQHGGQCQRNMIKSLPTHFKLIDIDELCIVDVSQSQRFVTLSYMWSVHGSGKDLQLVQSNVSQLSKPGGLELHQLPEQIFDTIMLCKELGERWLWIDRLCIVQDDPVTKGIEINAMDTIYGMAAFTLVAAVDSSKAVGLPGVRGRPRESFLMNNTRLYNGETSEIDLNFFMTVDKSTWNTRGWTFQERVLSTRCVYITNYQTYFTCPQTLSQEELGDFSQELKRVIAPPSHFSILGVHELASRYSYLRCACHYAARKLSFASDVEKAFTGVSNVLATEMGTSFLFCLPEKYFTTSLLWHSIAHPAMREKDAVGIPSWSWAGWSGAIDYNGPFSSNAIAYDIGTLVTFHIQTADRGLRQLDVEDEWFGEQIDFSSCRVLNDTKRRYTPDPKITEEMWRSCPHNPWEAIHHLNLSQSARQAAVKHPGSLVFNTTTAALSLRPQTTRNEDLDNISLDIYSPLGERMGNMQMDRGLMDAKVNLNQDQTFIVLCAGVLPKSKRRELEFEQYMYNREDHDKMPWLLIVMMVQQREGVCERLGIGYIEARLWGRAKPVWETIVLV